MKIIPNNGLNNPINRDPRIGGEAKGEAIKVVSRELESLFLYELLKAMRRTTLAEGGLQKDIYTSLFDLELSRVLAERGIGLGSAIERELMRRNDGQIRTEGSWNSYPSTNPGRLPLLPVQGRISSGFGMRVHPVTGLWSFHKGIDITAPPGSPVRAPLKGRVTFSGWRDGYGNLVEIDHGNGLITRYGHNSLNLVVQGQEVSEGEVIALVGSTGLSTGPHLHFEVISNGKPIDPEGFLKGLKG